MPTPLKYILGILITMGGLFCVLAFGNPQWSKYIYFFQYRIFPAKKPTPYKSFTGTWKCWSYYFRELIHPVNVEIYNYGQLVESTTYEYNGVKLRKFTSKTNDNPRTVIYYYDSGSYIKITYEYWTKYYLCINAKEEVEVSEKYVMVHSYYTPLYTDNMKRQYLVDLSTNSIVLIYDKDKTDRRKEFGIEVN